MQSLLVDQTEWRWQWEWRWDYLWTWQPETRQWEWTPTAADDFGFKTEGPPLPTNVVVRLTGSCANLFVDELSPALRDSWATELSARLRLDARLAVAPPCFTEPTVPTPLPAASPPPAEEFGAPAGIGSAVSTAEEVCRENEWCWIPLLLLLLCCCCCVPLCLCARRRRRRRQLEETLLEGLDLDQLDDMAFDDLVQAREDLAHKLDRLEKAQDRARPDETGASDIEAMEAYEIAVEDAEVARVRLKELEAMLPDPGEAKSALRARWDHYLAEHATEVRETAHPLHALRPLQPLHPPCPPPPPPPPPCKHIYTMGATT